MGTSSSRSVLPPLSPESLPQPASPSAATVATATALMTRLNSSSVSAGPVRQAHLRPGPSARRGDWFIPLVQAVAAEPCSTRCKQHRIAQGLTELGDDVLELAVGAETRGQAVPTAAELLGHGPHVDLADGPQRAGPAARRCLLQHGRDLSLRRGADDVDHGLDLLDPHADEVVEAHGGVHEAVPARRAGGGGPGGWARGRAPPAASGSSTARSRTLASICRNAKGWVSIRSRAT